MRLLLDTNALLFWLGNTLHGEVAELIASPDNEVFVSAVSVWEVAIKRSSGKLQAPDDLPEAIAGSAFDALPITLDHAHHVGRLPTLHHDPFDRLLIAQAQLEGLAVVTRDRMFSAYDIDVLAC